MGNVALVIILSSYFVHASLMVPRDRLGICNGTIVDICIFKSKILRFFLLPQALEDYNLRITSEEKWVKFSFQRLSL